MDGNPIASLYPAPPQPNQGALTGNPLAAIGALNQMTELQQRQRALQAQIAGGEIYRRALQPDGSIDMNSVGQGYAQSPAASYALPQQTSDILAQRQQSIANAKTQFELGVGQNQFVANTIGAMADNPNLTKEDVLNNVVAMSRNSNIPSWMLTGWANGLPEDPKALHGYMANLRNIAMGAPATAARVQGPPGAGGEPTTMTQGAAAYNPTMPVGTPMGAPESSGVMQADLGRARNFGQEIFPWQQALSKMEEMQQGGETFGPGSKGRQEMESFVYALSPTIASMVGVDPNKIANYAEVEKYLTQGLQARANSMGPHTNEGLATAATGTPNVHITDLAGVPLVKAAMGILKMDQAATLEASKGGGPNYTANRARIAAQLDPRAFMIDNMSPEQISSLQKSLKGAERQRFNASLRIAIDNGVINPPSQ